jgi:hypothetical protein
MYTKHAGRLVALLVLTPCFAVMTGAQQTGTRSALSSGAGLLTVESQPGQSDIYDLASMEKRGQLTFASPISMWSFSADGKRMLALTQEQTAFTFDTSRMGIKQEDSSTTASATQAK